MSGLEVKGMNCTEAWRTQVLLLCHPRKLKLQLEVLGRNYALQMDEIPPHYTCRRLCLQGWSEHSLVYVTTLSLSFTVSSLLRCRERRVNLKAWKQSVTLFTSSGTIIHYTLYTNSGAVHMSITAKYSEHVIVQSCGQHTLATCVPASKARSRMCSC